MLAALRIANQERQREWDTNDQITLSYRGNEMCGEVGEAIEAARDVLLQLQVASGKASNIIKKLERERLGIRGSRATVAQLAEELADVVICVDLIAMQKNIEIDLEESLRLKFNKTSEANGLKTRL